MTCSSNTTFSIRRFTALSLGLLALSLIGAGPAAGGETQRDMLRGLDALRGRAQAALVRRDPVAAEVMLREAVRGGVPADAVRALLGEALLVRGDRIEAHRVLEGGAFTPETASLGWRVRGQLALAVGDLRGAAGAFDEALKFAPRDADLWVAIASLRFSGGEQAEAIDAATRAVALDPNNVRALAFRGLLIREQFGLAAALPWFEAGLLLKPDDPGLLGEYAATLGDMGQYRAMLIVCRKLVSVDPKNPRPAFLQAVLAARAGKTDLARKILQRTGTALRDMPAAILLSGVLEYRAGNTNQAVEQFDRLVRMQPDNLPARQMLLRALSLQAASNEGSNRQITARFDGDADEAYATPYTLLLVGKAWQRLGNAQRSAHLLDQAADPAAHGPAPLPVGIDSNVLAVHYADAPNLAQNAVPYIRALLQGGRTDAAQGVADRLRSANPGAADAHLLAGDVRAMRGNAAGALADYNRAAAIRFNEPVLSRMAAALRALGRTREADAMTSRYLAQNPASLAAMKLLAAAWRGGPRSDATAAMTKALAARGQAVPLQ